MGSRVTATDVLLVTFARLLRSRYNARVCLFGSRACGIANSQSDYDVIAVADAFAGQRGFRRAPDRYALWREAGGFGQGLDLHCYTPEEFREEMAGLGYLGSAARRGELLEIAVGTETAVPVSA